MEDFALKLHESILKDVNCIGLDTFSNMYVECEDPIIAECSKKQESIKKIQKESKGRSQFAFTEPYWRQWNADLALMNEFSANYKAAERKPKKPEPIRKAPDARVKSHKFGGFASSPTLKPNKIKNIKLIKTLRSYAGKSNRIPVSEDLAYRPKEHIVGGLMRGRNAGKEPAAVTQLCDIPCLDSANAHSLTGGTTVFATAPRFPPIENSGSKSRPSTSNVNTLDANNREIKPGTGSPRMYGDSNGISFPVGERFRDKSGAGPGPGEYNIPRMFEEEKTTADLVNESRNSSRLEKIKKEARDRQLKTRGSSRCGSRKRSAHSPSGNGVNASEIVSPTVKQKNCSSFINEFDFEGSDLRDSGDVSGVGSSCGVSGGGVSRSGCNTGMSREGCRSSKGINDTADNSNNASRPTTESRKLLRNLNNMEFVGKAVFAYGCNMHEHAIYGMCLDGMCGKRGQWEETLQLQNDENRLVGDRTDYTQQFASLIPESRGKLSPLHVAAARADIPALITLSKLHYDINEPEAGTLNTPLHMAVSKCNYDVVCCLIDYYGPGGISVGGTLNVDLQNKKGDTALHIAARNGFGSIVKALCDANAQVVGLMNNAGKFILDEAKSHEIYQILCTGKERVELEAMLRDIEAKRKELESSNVESNSSTTSGRGDMLMSDVDARDGTDECGNKRISQAKDNSVADDYHRTFSASENMRRVQKQSYTVGYCSGLD